MFKSTVYKFPIRNVKIKMLTVSVWQDCRMEPRDTLGKDFRSVVRDLDSSHESVSYSRETNSFHAPQTGDDEGQQFDSGRREKNINLSYEQNNNPQP